MSNDWNTPHLEAGSSKPELDPEQVYMYNMRFCPYAQRTVLVLLAKEVPFKAININLKKKPDWFVESTFGKVPVILYKGDIIPESLITSDYVDELFPGPQLHPKDPTQKAKDRVFLEIFNKVITSYYKCLFLKEGDSIEALLKDLTQHLQTVQDELKNRGSKFFCGEAPGMLDYMMWPWMERIPVMDKLGMSQPEIPGLKEYMSNMWTVDSVKAYGLTADQHYLFLKQYVDKKEVIDYDILLEK